MKTNKEQTFQEAIKALNEEIKSGNQSIVSEALQNHIDEEEKEILEKLKSDKNFKNEFKFACKFLYANLLQIEKTVNDYIEQLNLNDQEIDLMKYAMEILKNDTMDYYFYIFVNLDEEPYTEPLVKEIVNVYIEATKEADEEIQNIDQEETESNKA